MKTYRITVADESTDMAVYVIPHVPEDKLRQAAAVLQGIGNLAGSANKIESSLKGLAEGLRGLGVPGRRR